MRWESDSVVNGNQSVYQILFYGGLVLGIISLIVTVVLFFLWNIPKVFREMTGHAGASSRTLDTASVGSAFAKREQAKYYNQSKERMHIRDAGETNETGLESNDKKENQTAEREPASELKMSNTGLNMEKLFEEATEVLTDSPYNKVVDATEVLMMDDDAATDVLRTTDLVDEAEAPEAVEQNAFDEMDAPTDVLTSDADSYGATDVLTSENSGGANDFENTPIYETNRNYEDPATDVLYGVDAPTDVLTSADAVHSEAYMNSSSEKVDVSKEDTDDMTTVLKSGYTDELSRKVRVLYNIIVVHSDETL